MADVGETQVWTITNTFDFAHPFHLHGFFFQVLAPTAGRAPARMEGHGRRARRRHRRFAVRLRRPPGMWMFHCHILDHAEAGMMGSLMVMEPE